MSRIPALLPQPWLGDFQPEPGGSVDWNSLLASYGWLRAMENSEQDSIYHAEGDVLTHTQWVTQEVVNSRAYAEGTVEERFILFATALLHDVCKPQTRVVLEGGRISHPGHSRMGGMESRGILWKMGCPPVLREKVCSMVVAHQVPFWLLERAAEDGLRIMLSISLQVPLNLLASFAECDAKGRICPDLQEMLDGVELFREAAREHGCLEAPYDFASPSDKVRFFRKGGMPSLKLHDTTSDEFELVMLSGLPGTEKSSWVASKTVPGGPYEGAPVVSMDAIRRQLGVTHEDNQGQVVQAAKAALKSHLGKRQTVIWDDLSIDGRARGPIAELGFDYGARVRMVMVEAPFSEAYARNADRPDACRVPDQSLARILRRWEAPTPEEANDVELFVNGKGWSTIPKLNFNPGMRK